MSQLAIKYVFHWPERGEQTLVVVLKEPRLDILLDDAKPPAWTALDNAKCRHCPLSSKTHPQCPLALALVEPLRLCAHAAPGDRLRVDVVMDDRLVTTETTVQRAMSSLLGLIMPASGCPHTQYFRPMARFHLPFSTPLETLYRSAGMYMLAQYFRDGAGLETDMTLTGLQGLYRNLHSLNRDFSKRLRLAAEGDAAFNAMVFLDLFTVAMPQAIQDSLQPLADLFAPYLQDKRKPD